MVWLAKVYVLNIEQLNLQLEVDMMQDRSDVRYVKYLYNGMVYGVPAVVID
jgi:hypothetical protein